MARSTGRHTYTIAAIVALLSAGAIIAFLVVGPSIAPPSEPGLVHSTEIRIAPEISGRLGRFAVTAGQQVRAGDELAELVNPELSAGLLLAEAQLGEAKAARDHVYAGVRVERVGTLERQTETAKADLLLAEQDFARKSKLLADGFASRQDYDRAAAALGVAQAKLASAQEAFRAANSGPIKEELAVADAKVEAAAASLSVVAARVDKLRIRAPVDGTVKLIVAEPGEAIVPAQPLMTLEASGRQWVSFNVREDHFDRLRLGAQVQLTSGENGAPIEAIVTETLPRGEFATWRAARVAGDHDLNTFLVRVDPAAASSGLQPGMTVWLAP